MVYTRLTRRVKRAASDALRQTRRDWRGALVQCIPMGLFCLRSILPRASGASDALRQTQCVRRRALVQCIPMGVFCLVRLVRLTHKAKHTYRNTLN